jgi:hypothetical protein
MIVKIERGLCYAAVDRDGWRDWAHLSFSGIEKWIIRCIAMDPKEASSGWQPRPVTDRDCFIARCDSCEVDVAYPTTHLMHLPSEHDAVLFAKSIGWSIDWEGSGKCLKCSMA